jgi:hypothetical protein
MYLEYQCLVYYQITDAPGRAARVERPPAHAGRRRDRTREAFGVAFEVTAHDGARPSPVK